MSGRIIDVHAHFVTDFYHDALLENGMQNPDGMPGIATWNVEEQLEFMKVCGFLVDNA